MMPSSGKDQEASTRCKILIGSNFFSPEHLANHSDYVILIWFCFCADEKEGSGFIAFKVEERVCF